MKKSFLPRLRAVGRSGRPGLAGALLVAAAALPGAALADWARVTDPADMADSSGDIRSISAYVLGENLHLSMSVHGVAAPATEQTPEGMSNRYYYHWLLDIDNNPATGRSNSEYEGDPTGVQNPVGYERAIQIGWRDGKPDGIIVYDPADEDNNLLEGYEYQAKGNTLTAVIPLADLGLAVGQTVAISAFQEGPSDGWATDWMESDTLALEGPNPAYARITDGSDMADSSGDLRAISASVMGDNLYLAMTVEGVAMPATEQTPEGMNNRYYYHWLLDIDNNPATGRSNAEYEGESTGVQNPVGYERAIQVGWRDGKPDGIIVYDPADEDNNVLEDYEYQGSGNTITAVIPLADIGLTPGQTIAFSAFQEGSSDGWATDWMESATLTLEGPAPGFARVTDGSDMADSSGDIRAISACVLGESLFLSMSVQAVAAPASEQTPEGMNNRYYYHWLLDIDNNPATGRSNAEYEGESTGVQNPVGYERAIQVGWRDGKPDGIIVYDPADEDNNISEDYSYQNGGNTLTAVIPLADLGLAVGQTIAISAFQEGSSDGWATDWMESAALTLEPPATGRMKIDGEFADWTEAAAAGLVEGVDDPQDMLDSSGDIRRIEATVENGYLYLRMSMEGIALPSVEETPPGMNNRYYYHWLLDIDNNPATGRSNAEYEGESTGIANPIGYERAVQIGWRNGSPDGVNVYDPADEDTNLVEDFEFAADGSSVEARVRLTDIGLVVGQTIAISAFQEGSSDGWATDWMESVVMTLVEGNAGGIDLETLFDGNPVGFSLRIWDDGDQQIDPQSATARVDGTPVSVTAGKDQGVTTITGRHPALLEPGSSHTVNVSVQVAGVTQSQDFLVVVKPYTVLPTDGMYDGLTQGLPGFVVYPTQLSSEQTFAGAVHENKAALAEEQFAGEIPNQGGFPYYNEVGNNFTEWVVEPVNVPGVINWFELAPGTDASLNFPDDDEIPLISAYAGSSGFPAEGVVVAIEAYLELEQGYHQLGLYTEGGHKVTSGFDPAGPVLSLVDNTDSEKVPSYYARSQFFDIVAPRTGYYPVRWLWFQTNHREEAGMMLELFSVSDKELHLLNETGNPASILAFRPGSGFISRPSVNLAFDGQNVTVSWTGVLQVSETVNGGYEDYADDSQSPMTIPVTEFPAIFARSRSK
ncbi:MAG: hypothetical protein H7A45_01505 [Verrucomicrobiales bacterium]|nr:hypothetical protein [Verrucomicrobiales bacterium]